MAKRKDDKRLRLEWVDPATLTDNPRNWRTHPEAQLAALGDVLADPEVGWAGACLFNERTGRLIDGHARKKQAITRGEKAVPVLVGFWSEAAEKKILLTLDPLAGMAEADPESLRALLAEVELDTGALRELGEGLAKVAADLPDDLQRQEEDAVELKKVEVRKPPKMAWVLIGIPTVRFGQIASDVERIAGMTGVVCQSTVNDG